MRTREAPLRTSSEMVLISATVVDKQGTVVTSLGPEHFRLAEEGGQQRISAVTLEDAAVSLIFVVDLSGSMTKALPDVRAAVAQLGRSSKPEDEYALITVRAEARVSVPFSASTREIEDFVLREDARGGTALIDGLILALHTARSRKHPRRAIVLLSDGYDTTSRYTWSELRSAAREGNTPIYAFCLPSYDDFAAHDEWQLQRIVNETGGRHVFVNKPKQFVDKLDRLDVHQQYVIAYRPNDRNYDGKYRQVKVSLVDAGRDLKVFWKRGYFAPSR